ncbi:threonine aldolase family protein [Actinophytocola sp. NPDC049390]|uniref:threonine aldolase family protein n=1 Tax=Actinophytocola sp. NPDC049390 TaxID=3363894 RepID=UPI0037A3739E
MSGVQRSVGAYGPPRRLPHFVLRRMLDAVSPGTMPDEPVAALERRVAELLGKPRALFFPTGTMAQQVALRIHAERTGRHAFTAHPANHLDLWEQRGYAVVHGLRYQPAGEQYRLLTRADLDEVKEPVGALLIELPQREIGGFLPTWEELSAQVAWARDQGAAVHLDGARIWESQPFYDRPHAEIAGLFDTVYVSLYKGLEGVRGAVLAGDEATIEYADVWRRRLGGAIPDAWPLALAAMVGLDEVLPRMAAFRDHAVAIAVALTERGVVQVLPDPPHTPMCHVLLPVPPAAAEAAGHMLTDEMGVVLFRRVGAESWPDRCRVEFTVGEHTMGFSPDEVVALFVDVVRRAS